jgi:Tfp pilus assembly PilM family ATPase/Tfp pilus assembly protein PilN
LARSNEITSTEKLLDVIRKKESDQPPAIKSSESDKPSVTPSPGRNIKVVRSRKASSGKPLTVGIDIGHEYLRMVKTARATDTTPEFVDQKRVPIPPTLNRQSSEFVSFLKTELNAFCGVNKNPQLWAIMSAANVEVHHIRIPRVDKKQIEAVVYYTIKKESPIDENITMLDFEVMGETIDQGVNKYDVMYYMAPRREVEELGKLFSLAGWPLTGVSITPFAFQNIFRTKWIQDYDGTAASLFIGNDFSRIDIYSRGNLILTRGIKAGMSSVFELLIECINERTEQSTNGLNRERCDKNRARGIIFSLSPDSPSLTPEDRYGLSEREIWDMVLPAMERLIRQVERTFEHYTETLGNKRVDKIYVSGVMNVYQPIVDYVGEQLGIHSEIFDPLSPNMACQYIGEEMYSCVSERIAMAPAMGIALSDNTRTPNLLYTHKDKQYAAQVKRINMSIFITFIVCAALCAGYLFYELGSLRSKDQQLLALDKQLSEYKTLVTRDLITQTAAALKASAAADRAYLKKYQGTAVISELSNLVQPNIRLLNLKANLGAAADKPQGIEIEGVVLGEKKSLQSSLTSYILKLDGSPLFNQVKIQKTSEENYRRGTVLRFTATMKIEGA